MSVAVHGVIFVASKLYFGYLFSIFASIILSRMKIVLKMYSRDYLYSNQVSWLSHIQEICNAEDSRICNSGFQKVFISSQEQISMNIKSSSLICFPDSVHDTFFNAASVYSLRDQPSHEDIDGYGKQNRKQRETGTGKPEKLCHRSRERRV